MQLQSDSNAGPYFGFLAGPNDSEMVPVSLRNPKTGRKRRWHRADDFGSDENARFDRVFELTGQQLPPGTCVRVLRGSLPRLASAVTVRWYKVGNPPPEQANDAPPVAGAMTPGVTPLRVKERERSSATNDDQERERLALDRYDAEEDTIRLSHFERLKTLAAGDFEIATLRMRQEHERAMSERDHSRKIELDAEQQRHERLLAEMTQRFEVHRAETHERFERETERAQAHATQMEDAKDAAVQGQLGAMRAELDAARAEMEGLNQEADEHAEAAQTAMVKATARPEDLQGWVMQQIQGNPHLVEKLLNVLTTKLTGEPILPPTPN